MPDWQRNVFRLSTILLKINLMEIPTPYYDLGFGWNAKNDANNQNYGFICKLQTSNVSLFQLLRKIPNTFFGQFLEWKFIFERQKKTATKTQESYLAFQNFFSLLKILNSITSHFQSLLRIKEFAYRFLVKILWWWQLN